MKAKFKRSASVTVNAGFQIAPMIDVVFVIMLFFMVMAGAVKVEKVLDANLPGPVITKGPVSTPDEIAIRVDDEGQVYLNDDPLDAPTGPLGDLTKSLVNLKANSDASKSEMLVTIYADELARYQRIIDTLDALNVAKIGNVTFQAASPD